jgi:large conductance mechanosensitive channel
MPPIGLALGDVDFAELFAVIKQGVPAAPYATLADAQAAGAVTVNYGVFINTIISFIIIAFAVFMLIRQINRMKREEPAPEPNTKECPYCFSTIPIKATRCGYCTSDLKGSA